MKGLGGKDFIAAAACALGQWILWLAYTNSTGYREMIAGSLAAMVSTLAVFVFAVQGKIHFRFRGRDISQVIYLPWQVLADTFTLLRALAKELFTRSGLPSRVVAVPFEVGRNSPAARGRHALAVTLTTITPNSLVLGIVREQKLMLYHQLLPGRVSIMTRHLGANP